MKIVVDYPPNIEELRKHFEINDSVVFTYGDTLYNPNNFNIDEALLKHEQTHSIQQRKYDTPSNWWALYITDVNFRLNEEAEAYRQQMEVIKKKFPHQRYRRLYQLACDLSSGIYGNIITTHEAIKMIQ